MRAGVIVVGEVEDLFLELGDRGEGAATDGFLGVYRFRFSGQVDGLNIRPPFG